MRYNSTKMCLYCILSYLNILECGPLAEDERHKEHVQSHLLIRYDYCNYHYYNHTSYK